MKTVWILCILMTTHSCLSEDIHGHVNAYESEIECNKAMSKYAKEAKQTDTTIWYSQCESTNAMLEEQKRNLAAAGAPFPAPDKQLKGE